MFLARVGVGGGGNKKADPSSASDFLDFATGGGGGSTGGGTTGGVASSSFAKPKGVSFAGEGPAPTRPSSGMLGSGATASAGDFLASLGE